VNGDATFARPDHRGRSGPSDSESISFARRRVAAKPSRESVMENDKQRPQAQFGQRTLTVSSLCRQWGAAHRKNECVVPSVPIKRKMVGCARACARSENPRRHEWLGHHNCARPLMNPEIIRLRLAHWYDAFLLKIFLTIGARVFRSVAVSAPDGKTVKAIPFRRQSA
jgi:hypothetical protein